jgi:hypothetical protein
MMKLVEEETRSEFFLGVDTSTETLPAVGISAIEG